eukprot:scaffold14600_cov150-Skeletonema_dohrnii-CCMP3373.AAC.6
MLRMQRIARRGTGTPGCINGDIRREHAGDEAITRASPKAVAHANYNPFPTHSLYYLIPHLMNINALGMLYL